MPDAGGSFTVTPASLAALGSRVTSVRAELDATAALVGDSSCLGSGAAADALDDFVAGWRDGRARISADLSSLAAALGSASLSYYEAENAVCVAIPAAP
jgi:hypothetical protein